MRTLSLFSVVFAAEKSQSSSVRITHSFTFLRERKRRQVKSRMKCTKYDINMTGLYPVVHRQYFVDNCSVQIITMKIKNSEYRVCISFIN